MSEITSHFDRFIVEANKLKDRNVTNLNQELVALENKIADNSGLPEWKRLELRSYMQEYRRKMVDGYDAGAGAPGLKNDFSGPRQGEYNASDT